MIRIPILAVLFLVFSWAVVPFASASESKATYSLIFAAPTLGSAGVEIAKQVDTSKAVGVAADGLIGFGYSPSKGNTLSMHLGLGIFGKNYHSATGYLQYGVGLAAHGDLFYGETDELGLGSNLKFGNEWKTRSGFIIGAEWLGASVVVSKSRATILPRLPSLRIGLAF